MDALANRATGSSPIQVAGSSIGKSGRSECRLARCGGSLSSSNGVYHHTSWGHKRIGETLGAAAGQVSSGCVHLRTRSLLDDYRSVRVWVPSVLWQRSFRQTGSKWFVRSQQVGARLRGGGLDRLLLPLLLENANDHHHTLSHGSSPEGVQDIHSRSPKASQAGTKRLVQRSDGPPVLQPVPPRTGL